MAGILEGFINPFVPNPAFNEPENNFIERGISSGIEKGLGKVGDSILHAGQLNYKVSLKPPRTCRDSISLFLRLYRI